MTGEVRIALAVAGDARAIAELHVRSWRWAYRGQLPDQLLASLSVEAREEGWRTTLEGRDPSVRVWLATIDGRQAGFCVSGGARGEEPRASAGEIYAIYLEEDAQGHGIGRALLDHAVADLRARGFAQAMLWVLDTNGPARRFYERAGWRADGGSRVEHRGGAELLEVRYRLRLAEPA